MFPKYKNYIFRFKKFFPTFVCLLCKSFFSVGCSKMCMDSKVMYDLNLK